PSTRRRSGRRSGLCPAGCRASSRARGRATPARDATPPWSSGRSTRRGGPFRAAGSRSGRSRLVRASTTSSDRDELAMDPERRPEPIADLTDRGMCLDRGDHRRQEIVGLAGGGFDPIEGRPPGDRVALGAHATHPLDLAALSPGIDLLERRLRLVRPVVAIAIDADHDQVASLDRLLDAIGRLLDLALLEPALDRRERAAD